MELKQRRRTKEMIIYLLMYLVYFVCLLEYFRDQVRAVSTQIPRFEVSRTKIQSYDPNHYVANCSSFQRRLWNRFEWIRFIHTREEEALLLQICFIRAQSDQLRNRLRREWGCHRSAMQIHETRQVTQMTVFPRKDQNRPTHLE